ncbi:histone deacetylase [Verrucomicrobiaceae bacterium N1E253]|uniref:Histone deacetylase n=1 Tax=Oceaniferula marina TaxID=2748318 RepID=A0A851GQX2_9BACT|nr:histone deacetylase [Oceaniferula marina]NWK56584.1 histone deacetylase [Oceaniferula marina]
MKKWLQAIVFLMWSCLVLSCTSQQLVADPDALDRIPVVYDKGYRIGAFGLEKLHPFDIGKYQKIHRGLKKAGVLNEENEHRPEPLARETLLLVHSQDYLETLKSPAWVAVYLEAPAVRLLPKRMLKRSLIDPFILASGGTLKASRLALDHGAAINLGGGYHHAKPESGEGFCVIADVPIAIRKLQKEGEIKRALVVDTDIHQGNGTIVCLEDDPSTFTFSMHESGIYPVPKETGDRDVSVPAGVTDDAYMRSLKHWLPKVIAKSKPDIVFYVSGCDALAGDPLANGTMTHEGIARRDAYVLAECRKRKIPFVMTLAGGYSKDAWQAQYKSIVGLMKKEDVTSP